MITPRNRAILDWIHATCERIDTMRRERANALARRAGFCEMRNVWHNAILALQCGEPWRGVDYSLLREAIRVEESRIDVWRMRSRLISAVLDRSYPELRHAA